MSDSDDATGTPAAGTTEVIDSPVDSPIDTPVPIDTSDAASADGPAEQMSGRVRTAITLGPFLTIWLLWWRLGDVFLHRDQEAKVPEWLYEVPRSFIVDWFNFAGRERGHKATGWVNTWFDHLRYEELFDFTLSWHAGTGWWLVPCLALVAVAAWRGWQLRSGAWMAVAFSVAWLGWGFDLFDWVTLSATPWAFVAAAGLIAIAVARIRNGRDFRLNAAATAVVTIGWVAIQVGNESFNVKYLFRRVAGWLEFPLDLSEGLLISGHGPWHLSDMPWLPIFAAMVGGSIWLAIRGRSVRWAVIAAIALWFAVVSLYEPWHIPALPWIVLAGLFGIIGHRLGGWRLALLCIMFIVYASFVGDPPLKDGAETRWDKTMITLSAVLVAVPIATLIGGSLGVWAAKRRRVERLLIPVMNLTQAMPHFTFLIPVGVFIGVSHKAGVIATIAYAIPPMARLTILGVQGISKEVVEAGIMSGCTPRQMLWKVEIPAARHALLVGINQVVMECLAMVVIASFVGTAGLGQDLLFRLTGLHIGAGMEIGIAIVVMAITLDRLSQALGSWGRTHHEPETPFHTRHPYLIASSIVVGGGVLMANLWDSAQRVPKGWMWGHAQYWETAVDWSKVNLYSSTIWFRDQLESWMLLPLRDAFLTIPWIAAVLLVFTIGWFVNGRRLAIMSSSMVAIIALTGFWPQAMTSLYQLTFAVFLASIIGVPFGIWSAGSERRNSVVQVLLDGLQTFPSFVYLLPAIMFFSVSETAVIFAVVLSVSVPAIRYTIFGVRNVPGHLVEAATMSGCTKRQTLWKVKVPLAVPEIMLGINQTIMFGLFMVMIGGLIKTSGLARDLIEAQPNVDSGRAIIGGLAVACIGMAADLIISEWADKRKKQLGLIEA
jgi:glycine betaine/proline transport system permease protein